MKPETNPPSRLKPWLWMAAIWLASVLALSVVALMLRWLIRA